MGAGVASLVRFLRAAPGILALRVPSRTPRPIAASRRRVVRTGASTTANTARAMAPTRNGARSLKALARAPLRSPPTGTAPRAIIRYALVTRPSRCSGTDAWRSVVTTTLPTVPAKESTARCVGQ